MSKLQHIEETTDAITGELKTVKKTFSVKTKHKEDFFFVFLSALNAMEPLSRPSDIKVLMHLCTMAEFNTGKVALTAQERKRILKALKVKAQSFTNSLARLKTAGLIIGGKGEYVVNPQYFWKGTTDERTALLKKRSAELLLKYEQG
tara:strand:- start:11 stop:451 length:441 start_codon:yes stop_codon:yes gene_type:complete